jgi:hypothetical protein
MKVVAAVLACSLPIVALAQRNFQYRNEFSTAEEAERMFGMPPKHDRQDPTLDAGGFRFELGSSLECGNIDVNANIKGQWEDLQSQLKKIVPKKEDVGSYISTTALLTLCYAYPTVCAQLRHDWLSIQGKLNLRAQACAAVDKFIDNQADKGARQLRAEAQAQCARERLGKFGGDMASALQDCQKDGVSGLKLRDFQSGVMRTMAGAKQKVLQSMLSFAKDETSYAFLSTFLGEVMVNTDGQWEPLFDKGLMRPADVADAFLTKGQGLACARVGDVLAGRYVTSNVYETEVAQIIRRKLSRAVVEDLDVLSSPDRQRACLALGRAVGREAALKATSKYESLVSTGLLNTAIPEALRAEYRDRISTAFPALRAAVESEDIPSVEAVRAELAAFARAQRAKTALLAAEANRGRTRNTIEDAKGSSECLDSLTCR